MSRSYAGIVVGTFGGARLAGCLDARLLTVAFTLPIYDLATQMLFEQNPATEAGKSGLPHWSAGFVYLPSVSPTARRARP